MERPVLETRTLNHVLQIIRERSQRDPKVQDNGDSQSLIKCGATFAFGAVFREDDSNWLLTAMLTLGIHRAVQSGPEFHWFRSALGPVDLKRFRDSLFYPGYGQHDNLAGAAIMARFFGVENLIIKNTASWSKIRVNTRVHRSGSAFDVKVSRPSVQSYYDFELTDPAQRLDQASARAVLVKCIDAFLDYTIQKVYKYLDLREPRKKVKEIDFNLMRLVSTLQALEDWFDADRITSEIFEIFRARIGNHTNYFATRLKALGLDEEDPGSTIAGFINGADTSNINVSKYDELLVEAILKRTDIASRPLPWPVQPLFFKDANASLPADTHRPEKSPSLQRTRTTIMETPLIVIPDSDEEDVKIKPDPGLYRARPASPKESRRRAPLDVVPVQVQPKGPSATAPRVPFVGGASAPQSPVSPSAAPPVSAIRTPLNLSNLDIISVIPLSEARIVPFSASYTDLTDERAMDGFEQEAVPFNRTVTSSFDDSLDAELPVPPTGGAPKAKAVFAPPSRLLKAKEARAPVSGSLPPPKSTANDAKRLRPDESPTAELDGGHGRKRSKLAQVSPRLEVLFDSKIKEYVNDGLIFYGPRRGGESAVAFSVTPSQIKAARVLFEYWHTLADEGKDRNFLVLHPTGTKCEFGGLVSRLAMEIRQRANVDTMEVSSSSSNAVAAHILSRKIHAVICLGLKSSDIGTILIPALLSVTNERLQRMLFVANVDVKCSAALDISGLSYTVNAWKMESKHLESWLRTSSAREGISRLLWTVSDGYVTRARKYSSGFKTRRVKNF